MPDKDCFDSIKITNGTIFNPGWIHDRFLWLLVLATILLFRPVTLSPEGVQNYAYAHSVLLDRDLDFDNQYRAFLDGTSWYSQQDLARDAITELPLNRQSIAPSLSWAPFLVPAFGFESMRSDQPGFGLLSFAMISLTTAFYGLCGLVLVYMTLLKFFSRNAARFATLLVWLASPLLYYMHFDTGTEHPLCFALIAAMLAITLTKNRPLKYWALYGLCAGMLITIRLGHLLIIVPLMCREIAKVLRDRTISYNKPAMLTVTFLLFSLPVALQTLTWKLLHGPDWLNQVSANPSQAFNPFYPWHLIEVLFSPHHGLFYWHPVLVLGMAGLFATRTDTRLKTAALLFFLAVWWWTASSTQWWAGTSFGHRMYTIALPCLAYGAASLFHYYPTLRVPVMSTLVVAILWNLNLVYQFDARKISHRDPVKWSQMLPWGERKL